jgi:hypothetical protein
MRPPARMGETGELADIIRRMLQRWFHQHGEPSPAEGEAGDFAARLSAVVADRGLPPPLAEHERGSPGGMSEAECAPLVERIVRTGDSALWREAARQLVKACFYPEFKECRDSFRQRTADGSCRRQELARVRDRLSGSHCVDCPHWVGLPPDRHEEFLASAWCGDREEFRHNRETFLPEDFRALRRWLWREARRGRA